jgi:transposase
MGVLKMGTVALDGTKIHANASRHSALSYQRRVKGSNEGIWLPFTEHGKQGLSD